MFNFYTYTCMVKKKKENQERYIQEHPNEFGVITPDLQEYFFKTEVEMEKFLNPEKIEAIKRGEKPAKEIVSSTPPLCFRIPNPKNPLLKQLKLPLELRL